MNKSDIPLESHHREGEIEPSFWMQSYTSSECNHILCNSKDTFEIVFLFGSKLKETRSYLSEFGYCLIIRNLEISLLNLSLIATKSFQIPMIISSSSWSVGLGLESMIASTTRGEGLRVVLA